jgi:hypothetical protein
MRKKGRKVKVVIEPTKPINNINSIVLYIWQQQHSWFSIALRA